jgi:hypothetical protein
MRWHKREDREEDAVMENRTEPADRRDRELVRISLSISPALRKNIRIAAAYADMDVADWAAQVLKLASDRAIDADRGEERSSRGSTG